MQKPIRPHSGISAEARIAFRRSQLIDTAYQLMKEGLWLNVSMTQLCERASLNKRYFYENFKNLDELAIAIFENLTNQVQTIAFDAILQATQLRMKQSDYAVSVIEKIISFLLDEPERIRILFTDQLTGLALIKARLEIKNHLIDSLVLHAKHYYQAESQNDPMIQMTATMLIGGTVEILLAWQSNKLAMTKAQLIKDLALLWQSAGDTTAQIVKDRK